MFTGIVETIGTIQTLPSPPTPNSGTALTITSCAPILPDAHLGDSISINGTCLTITAFTSDTFTVGLSPETLRRTTLGSLGPNSRVNLERAVLASTRMGGHFVQGHVDTVATIESVVADGEAVTVRLRPRERGVVRYVVEKGYVALDGASLTVTRVEEGEGWWEVMLIAYTRDRVVGGGMGVGEEVNVEVDMVGKYVERSVRGYFEGLGGMGGEGGGGGGVLERMVGRMVEEKMGGRTG